MPHMVNEFSAEELYDCELAALKLTQTALELRAAVAQGDRRAMAIGVDSARQFLQVLACSSIAPWPLIPACSACGAPKSSQDCDLCTVAEAKLAAAGT